MNKNIINWNDEQFNSLMNRYNNRTAEVAKHVNEWNRLYFNCFESKKAEYTNIWHNHFNIDKKGNIKAY